MKRISAPIGALLALVALGALVGASALAAPGAGARDRAPHADASHEAGAAPSEKNLDKIVSRLDDVGIATDADAVAALAAKYGVGGAVRLLAWADASGMSADEIGAMFDAGMGWGEIARQLNEGDDSLSLRPGNGWVMGKSGGHGHSDDHGLGRAGAPGQLKKP